MSDPRDKWAEAGAGSAACLNPEGTDFESLDDYLARLGLDTDNGSDNA